MHNHESQPSGVVAGTQAKIRKGRLDGNWASKRSEWLDNVNGGRLPHEVLGEKAGLLAGEMHKALEGVEKADLGEARQAIKRALEKGTSVRKIKKKAPTNWWKRVAL